MSAKFSHTSVIAAAGMVVAIAYGSLYPFDFSLPAAGPGPVQALVKTWANRPGRGDFVANVLLYIPLGFFGALSFGERASLTTRFLGAVLLGVLLSIAMELAQYYDVGRDTEATDVYANALGSALGAVAGIIFGSRFRWPLIDQIALNPVPSLLLFTWVAYRLHPFVPTIDLHKYWNTLKPIIPTPTLSSYDLFRHTAIWLTVYLLIGRVGTALRLWLLIPLFAGAVLFSKIVIVSASLSVAEITGALTAYMIWAVFRPFHRAYLALTIVMFSLTVIAQRLEPFQFTSHSVPFSWIPFRSFLQGSIEVDVLSFLEKLFLYGSLIWLLMEAGIRRSAAAALVASVLFATSFAETYLPHRSAEVTDAVMALAIAAVFGLMTTKDEMTKARSGLHRP
jgi:glycopeptide antibiotics resistance protein